MHRNTSVFRTSFDFLKIYCPKWELKLLWSEILNRSVDSFSDFCSHLFPKPRWDFKLKDSGKNPTIP